MTRNERVVVRSVSRESNAQQRSDRRQSARDELPESLKQLKLSQQQKQDILAIYRDSDREAEHYKQ